MNTTNFVSQEILTKIKPRVRDYHAGVTDASETFFCINLRRDKVYSHFRMAEGETLSQHISALMIPKKFNEAIRCIV